MKNTKLSRRNFLHLLIFDSSQVSQTPSPSHTTENSDMSSSLAPYLGQVRSVLERSLPSMECYSSSTQSYPIRPHVELRSGPVTSDFVLRPRSTKERCLVESSSNSIRVSFLFKQQNRDDGDPIEKSILSKYMKFFQQRADQYVILRRKPLDGYSISFLVLNKHVAKYGQEAILQTILDFVSQLDRECSHVKISVNARARLVATEFMKAF